MALTMALKTAEDARKEADVTKNKMAPLIQRVKNAQEKYEEAALAAWALAGWRSWWAASVLSAQRWAS